MLDARTTREAAAPLETQARLDRITRTALRLSGAQAAFISLMEAGGRRCASVQGQPADSFGHFSALCAHTPDGAAPLIVADADMDARFCGLPPIAGAGRLRFYAGWPLHDGGGRRIGTFGVIDCQPRLADDGRLEMLDDLARWTESELDNQGLRNALSAAAESESRLHSVLDKTGEGIITLDQYGLITSINRTTVGIFGYQPEEVIGQSINILMPEQYHHAHDGYLQNFRDTGKTRVIGMDREVAGRRKDGSHFTMAITVNEMWLDGRRGFAGIVRDLTELRERERKLHETSTLLQAVMSNTSAFVYVRDLDGHFLFVNKEYERVFGVTAEEVIGKSLEEVFPAEMAQYYLTRDHAVLEGGGTRLEDELPLKDGNRVFLVVRKPLLSEKGEVYGVYGIGTDITQRKQAEQFKNEFISTVSHELRTPLTSIRGSLGLLSGGVAGEMPERAKSLLHIATSNCERLVRLINDILDIEKIESGHVRFDLVTQRMLPLVEQALAAIRDYAAQFGVRFELLTDDPEAVVAVDGDRIVQVIVNLLSNAAKFSPPDSSVLVRLTKLSGSLRLSVIDRGQGISDEFRPRVFQKFAQADASDTRQKGGTGLGLSISRSIVERHHGRIGFHSTPGAGSEFYFDLPLAAPARQAAHAQGRVLVCEDDHDIAHLLGMMLSQAGMASDVAYDARQARRLLAQGKYDAVTLDLSLPQEDGLSLLRWMRAQQNTRNLPVVVVSARAADGHRELTGGAVGIIDWIPKPIDQVRLVAALQAAMRCSKKGMPHLLRVLHVEDDLDLARVVAALLEPSFAVSHAATLAEAHRKLATETFNLILLDLNLSDGHGSELLGALPQRNAATPVVIFSAEEADRTAIAGVHAALVKSRTSNEQLLAILQELLRHAQPEQTKQQSEKSEQPEDRP